MAKILVADDESNMRHMVRLACERAGHEILEASDAPSAVLAYQRERPDLLVLDVGMPGGGAPFVLNSLRFGGAHQIGPVLVITGTLHEAAEEIQRMLQVDRVLTKPFRINDLVLAVAELLAKSAKAGPKPPPPPPQQAPPPPA